MLEADLFLIFVRRLNELGFPYMITGSVAGVLYGEPRVREGGTEKHVADIRSMLTISAGRVRQAELDRWISKLGLGAEWTRVSAVKP